jgi:hypothetical protein
MTVHREIAQSQRLPVLRGGHISNDARSFIKLMRDKGYQVMPNEVSILNGKVVEVKVPERKLSLMYVPPAVCQQSGKE